MAEQPLQQPVIFHNRCTIALDQVFQFRGVISCTWEYLPSVKVSSVPKLGRLAGLGPQLIPSRELATKGFLKLRH